MRHWRVLGPRAHHVCQLQELRVRGLLSRFVFLFPIVTKSFLFVRVTNIRLGLLKFSTVQFSSIQLLRVSSELRGFADEELLD